MKKIIIVSLLFATVLFFMFGMSQNMPHTASNHTDNTTPATEHNTKIEAIVSKNCNYIYHMLSVSNCGYDNEYGQQYKSYHAQADLETLKKYESYLTVAGGEHSGELYGLCVGLPASLEDGISLSTYFEALIDLFESDDIESNLQKYKDIYEQSFAANGIAIDLDSLKEFYGYNEPLKKEIAAISKVLLSNYDIYTNKIWDTSKAELTAIADALNQELTAADYASKWEEALDCTYAQGTFFAVLCNAIEDGPNCIDISSNKDVFFSSSTAKLISHEFGIYLLKDLLQDTEAFYDFSYYNMVEGLAEYFNIIVSGGDTEIDWDNVYIDFYKQLRDKDSEITAKEMFLRAVDSLPL